MNKIDLRPWRRDFLVGLRKIVANCHDDSGRRLGLIHTVIYSQEVNSGHELRIFLKKLLNPTDTTSVEKMKDIQ